MNDDVPKLDSLFRIHTLLLIRNQAMSGYDIAKELETIDRKPSPGKLYPFLHELRDNGYVYEVEGTDSSRGKSVYHLTEKGEELVEDLLTRMSNLLDARLEQMLEACHHCGVQLYDAKVTKVIGGKEYLFCCEHCMGAFNA